MSRTGLESVVALSVPAVPLSIYTYGGQLRVELAIGRTHVSIMKIDGSLGPVDCVIR